jgi:hypothetical protein
MKNGENLIYQIAQNRESLIYQFAECMVHDMDGDSLMVYALEKLREDYAQYSNEVLLAEISEYYPELLEEQ